MSEGAPSARTRQSRVVVDISGSPTEFLLVCLAWRVPSLLSLLYLHSLHRLSTIDYLSIAISTSSGLPSQWGGDDVDVHFLWSATSARCYSPRMLVEMVNVLFTTTIRHKQHHRQNNNNNNLPQCCSLWQILIWQRQSSSGKRPCPSQVADHHVGDCF